MRSAADRSRLVALLEERQDEASFENAKLMLDAELACGEDARVLYDYGYIHECRGGSWMRRAIRYYDLSLELDPANEQTRHQLIGACAKLGETDEAIALYTGRLADAPDSVAEHRCLAHAYLAAGELEAAVKVVEAGLTLEPDDVTLLEQQGVVRAGRGEHEAALAAWERAVALDDEVVDARYSRVFLLQRLGRLEDAAAEWETIIAWLLERGFDVEAEWPRRELASVRDRMS